jgi:hypothetical protein
MCTTTTSYFDPVWNTFPQHTDGSLKWIPKQIVTIGEDYVKCMSGGSLRGEVFDVVRNLGRENNSMVVLHLETG